MRRLAQAVEQCGLLLAAQAHGVDHVLPAGQRAAEQPVALLNLVPAVHLQLAAGHAQAGARAQPLRVEQCLFVELAIADERHDIHRRQVAQPVAVQQDLAAGIAAAEVRAALEAGGLVDPARLAGEAHLLEVPVQLLARRLAAVEDGIVAHLAVGDGLVDLPAAAHLAVEAALRLNALRVVLVDQADLGRAAHAAGDDVFADDVRDVQQVDRAQLRALAAVAQAGRADDAVDLVQHRQHRLIAAGRAAEHLQPLAARADGIVFDHDAPHARIFEVGQDLEVVVDRLRPALLGIADGQVDRVAGEGQVRVFQPLLFRARVVRLVDDLQICADLRQLLRVRPQHAHAHAAADHQQVEQVVVGVEVVDDLEGAVVIGHRVRLETCVAPTHSVRPDRNWRRWNTLS